jgi:hypothetical protein
MPRKYVRKIKAKSGISDVNASELLELEKEWVEPTEKSHPVYFYAVPLFILFVGGLSFMFHGKIKDFFSAKASYDSGDRIAAVLQKQEEMGMLLEKVAGFIPLPEDEDPTVMTVRDPARLDDPFFKDAKEGDRLIIYPKANKAILWDSARQSIIRTAEVSLGD